MAEQNEKYPSSRRAADRRRARSKAAAGRASKSVPAKQKKKPASATGRRRAAAPGPAREPGPHDAAFSPLPGFLVVGVGGSAGGYEAFSKLLRALPHDIGVAFVLVQHLDPTQESLLASLLGTRSPLPVVQVSDGMRLEPNRVHVIPPDAQVTVHDRRLRLAKRPPARSEHDRANRRAGGMPQRAQFLPIDAFFRSLAEYGRSRAIGIVLSGLARDGTLGLQEIKAAGGIAIAQDPRTAGYDSMPRAAIASGAVDLVLGPEQIAEELVRIARHPLADGSGAVKGPAPLAGEEHLAAIFAALKQSSGVDFTHYRLPTIRRRLQRRIVLHKLEDLGQYADFLKARPEEVKALYQDLLINVTRFFRDEDSFRVLAEKVFPTFLGPERGAPERSARSTPAAGKRGPGPRPGPARTIRVWIPGCSTGEEAYSVAIALLEFLGERAHEATIQIFATDVADVVIERARAGIYPEAIAADVSPERLRRYFTRADGHYRINKVVRDMVVFARQDLTRDPPFSRLDLIVCRNVLIYLGGPLQKRLIAVFHYALKPGGHLLLAGAETVGPHSDLFVVADRKHRLYVKRAAGQRPGMSFPPRVPAAPLRAAPLRPTLADARHGGDLQGEANRAILSRYAPPGVLVDADYHIIQFRGHTGPFLEPAPGDASLNLLKMARQGLLYGLRSALQEARTRDGVVRKEGLRVRDGGRFREVAVEVIPLSAAGDGRHYLVLFGDASPGAPNTPGAPGAAAPPAAAAASPSGAGSRRARRRGGSRGGGGGGADDPRITHLEAELAASRDYLQTIIQDLEAANEELQSANEEILSSNEELQSTNEELDTAREELQSTNEELTTLNDELSGRNEELSRVNSDLMNLLANVNIAIVMVAIDLRIRRFTPLAEKLLNLIPTDVGRRIGDVKPNLDCPDLEKLISEAIETVTVKEQDCRDRDGRAYSLRVRPYRNLDNRIDGAVLALVDVEALRGQERPPRESGGRTTAAGGRAAPAEPRPGRDNGDDE